ncbi:DNA polymerase/3'-5' exonuclease PolX [Blastopirellula marina]|uniref:DNA-directed DNA polymerase n=1 Tax=Blastopirellula marina TaxID=124 RepID=A0A2S8G763_9BACT|nr:MULTISPECIES: DNA polymerase/3'-5' exonuclease PolX [Pirellulaceae]PQO40298.1 DNA polymerase/3'-5' exonuclease PolX [Blastopirellula marina]RCS55846.1 DNA polymerase/3'-5' exonuclease PolX [Bremerella cremea]
MNNAQIAAKFEMLADLLEFQGANSFRIRAYRNAARTIESLSQQISDILNDTSQKLTDFEGIGKDLAEKCQVLVETGKLPQLEDLQKKIPPSVLAMLRIPGLGPKKAAVIYKELGISTLEGLREACQDEKIRALKGFGAKTEQTILSGIDLAATADQRVYWAKADKLVQRLREHLESAKGIEKLTFAGSYRRGKETVGDIDILTVAESSNEAMDRLGEFPDLEEVIARGDTKMSIRLASNMQVDLRVVPAKSYGAAMQYFTGSKEHNVKVRGIAKQRGLKINEYGVFRVNDDGSETYVAGETEEDVYAALDLPCFPPELRENRDEFKLVETGLPKLITVEDIVGDMHMHTDATDGLNTLEEMIEAGIAKGYQYIAITDHSKRVSMANGLNAERLLEQWKTIDKLRNKYDGKIQILKGLECDILEQGGMDLPDEVLEQGDWIIASVHYGQGQPKQQITDRIVGALENPNVCIIAHPTGRLINRREPYEVDLDAVFQCAKENKKFVELNANPARLDLNDVYCHAAKGQGIPIGINSDGHKIEGLDVIRYGIMQARRAGLTKEDVVNTRSWDDIRKLLGRV